MEGAGCTCLEGAGGCLAPGLRTLLWAMAGAPPLAPPPTWTRPGVVEAAVPGEEAGLVTEARPVDPVQPPAAGEAGGVPAGAAAPRLSAAGQGPGPQPRQRAQRQPQGLHGRRSRRAGDATHPGSSPSGQRLSARPGPALPRAWPPPPAPPLPAGWGGVLRPPGPRWGARCAGRPAIGARGTTSCPRGPPGSPRRSRCSGTPAAQQPGQSGRLSWPQTQLPNVRGHADEGAPAPSSQGLRMQRGNPSNAVRAGHPDFGSPGTSVLCLLRDTSPRGRWGPSKSKRCDQKKHTLCNILQRDFPGPGK